MMSNSKTYFLLAIVVLFGLGFVEAKTGPAHNKVVVCYISTWAVYRPGFGSYSLDDFDANLCTHAIYAFTGLDVETDYIKSLDPWQDLEENYGKGGFKKLTGLRQQFPHLKVSVAIGGWNEGSKNYSIMAADPEKRRRFVNSAVEFVRKHNFDGLDLDWEYPTQREGMPYDKENFVLLVKELKEKLEKFNLLLTSAFGAGKATIDSAYNVKVLAQYLDFFHIMCYDYHGSWDKKIGPNAPLFSEGVLNVKFSIDYFLELGAPKSKLVVGIPFYGRTFITDKPGLMGDESNDVGFQGMFTRENGFLGYNEICNHLANKTVRWETSFDDETKEAIAKNFDANSLETKVVVYDSSRSVAVKMRELVVRMDLAGAMIWSVDTDDFRGDCKPELDIYEDFGGKLNTKLSIPRRTNQNYKLLRTVNEAIIVATVELKLEQQASEDNDKDLDKDKDKDKDKENEVDVDDNGHKDKGAATSVQTSFLVLTIDVIFVNILRL